jgi:hypothetical protein
MSSATLRWIKPKPGLVVRDPATGQPIPPHGKGVVWSSFWERRALDQDIVQTDQKSVEAGDAKAATADQTQSSPRGDAA